MLRAEIYIAQMTTPNFHFEAMACTERAARDALLEGLEVHRQQYRHRSLPPDWYTKFDIEVTKRDLWRCYRDREPITDGEPQ